MRNIKNFLTKLNKQRKSPYTDGGGIVVGMEKKFKGTKTYFIPDDVHTLCIGATRSGKSRSVVLPTVCTLAMAGESMIISDPKGELYAYTSEYLKKKDYYTVALDFRNPKKSVRYNLLQEIIDAVNRDDIEKAKELASSMAESLGGSANEHTGEKIWTEGEKAVLAATIMAVVYDNRDHPEYQNLTNVYLFIAEMCKIGERMPLDDYLADIDYNHPAKALLAAALVAPSKTRGSFYASALATLRLFVDNYIYNITSSSDFSFSEIPEKKCAIFIILPDEKKTYYNIASLFVDSLYCKLVQIADARGGRLKIRCNFILDEFGNFSRIPDFETKMTVGAGRGIRFDLFIQSMSQIEEVYGKNNAQTVFTNCVVWIYLSSDPETHKQISARCGKYTCSSQSRSASASTGLIAPANSSASIQLISRDLLTPDEVGHIQRPYMLVMYGDKYPAMMYAPDLSKTVYNKILGMGDKEHNRVLREEADKARPEKIGKIEIQAWGIWEKYTQDRKGGGQKNSAKKDARKDALPLRTEAMAINENNISQIYN